MIVTRLRQVFAALRVAARNVDVRRAELAWGASVSAEWAHFVALGVFAYDHGGSTAVGIAGLVRLLPAAVIAPFASSLGDRFRRERFLLGVVLLGAAALVVSAAGAVLDDRDRRLRCRRCGRCLLDAVPAGPRRAASVTGANGEGADRCERSDLDDREPRHPARPARRRRAGRRSPTSERSLRPAPWLFSRQPPSWPVCRSRVASLRAASGAGVEVWQGFKAIAEVPRARLLVGLIASQTFVRGCLNVLIVVTAYQVLDAGASEVGYLTAAIGAGGLVGALGAVSLRGERLAPPFAWALVFWGVPIMLIAPLPYPVRRDRPARGDRRSEQRRRRLRVHAPPAHRSRRGADPRARRDLGPRDGRRGGRLVRRTRRSEPCSGSGRRSSSSARSFRSSSSSRIRRFVEIDSEVAPAAELALIDGVALFAPLSLVAKERIASHLVQVDVAAGDTVIRAGRDRRPFLHRRQRRADDRRRLAERPGRPGGLLRRDRACSATCREQRPCGRSIDTQALRARAR